MQRAPTTLFPASFLFELTGFLLPRLLYCTGMPFKEIFISQHIKNERHLAVSQARSSKDVLAQRGVLPRKSITSPRLPAIVAALAGTPHPDDQLPSSPILGPHCLRLFIPIQDEYNIGVPRLSVISHNLARTYQALRQTALSSFPFKRQNENRVPEDLEILGLLLLLTTSSLDGGYLPTSFSQGCGD